VAISGGNTRVGDEDILIDASRCFDADGDPGDMVFQWACTPPPYPLAGAAHPPLPGYAGCQSADGSAAAVDGAASPGIRVQLLGTTAGANYTLSLTITKGDRAATASVWLLVVAKSSPPVISIDRLTSEKVNPAQKLTLRASVASAFPASLVTEWSVASPPDLAGLLSRDGVAGTPLSSQSLVVNAGALPPRATLVFRLSARDGGGSSVAEVTVPVSGAPTGLAGDSSKGAVSVSPPGGGKGLSTPFSLRCDGWTDTDLPLLYAFAYSVPTGPQGSASAQRTLLGDFTPASELAGVLLPAGDSASQYAVSVVCLVQNSFGAMAESEPAKLRVEWESAVLTDMAVQSALVNAQAAEAASKVLTGNPDSALAVVSGLSALLNTDPTTRRRLSSVVGAHERRRRLFAAAATAPTEAERAKAEHRSSLLGVVSDVVLVSTPSTTVRLGSRLHLHIDGCTG
jgi:hypothetical protein